MRKVTVMMIKPYSYTTTGAITKESVMENLKDAIDFKTIDEFFIFTIEGVKVEAEG